MQLLGRVPFHTGGFYATLMALLFQKVAFMLPFQSDPFWILFERLKKK